MRFTLIIITAILFAFTQDDHKTERIGVSGPFEFNDTKFELKWTDKPNDNYYIQEYLPKDELLEKFNQMLTCHLFITDLSVKEAVSQRVGQLEERKKNDPNCMYIVNESPDGKELMLDFMLGEHTEKNMMISIEFNIYRYKQVKLKKGKMGILVFAYSKRSYGDDITPFLEKLPEDRIKYLNQMILMELPTVKIK